MRILSYIFLLLIILLGACFAMLNSQIVTIHYFVGQHNAPLSLIFVLVFAIGCILGLLVTGTLLIKAKIQIHRLHKRLKLAEKEIENLRAIPLQDKH